MVSKHSFVSWLVLTRATHPPATAELGARRRRWRAHWCYFQRCSDGRSTILVMIVLRTTERLPVGQVFFGVSWLDAALLLHFTHWAFSVPRHHVFSEIRRIFSYCASPLPHLVFSLNIPSLTVGNCQDKVVLATSFSGARPPEVPSVVA